ncbi:MAG: hypothetical protein HYV96_09040 [Opitutae bacterium]|nr:hypothetical protein [Opitutae bacterium]
MALLSALPVRASDAVWQWSVPLGEGRAFLWIPENCPRVRAVVVAQHNMIEQGLLEHATLRRTLAALGIAEVFIAPPFDRPFDFHRGAGERFDATMRALAAESGYDELAAAPVVPMGHSACASFPWNFAAWAPERTLAILSIKGDAPQTNLTGSGAPNPDWGARSIDGIPGLMVMSEQEWWEARLAPLIAFRAAHPRTPLAVLCDTGHGHFDASDELVEFLALFIRKAAEARLVAPVSDRRSYEDSSPTLPANDVELRRSQTGATLRPVLPAAGWLVARWRADRPYVGAVAPAARSAGAPDEAFWSFDEEHARATAAYQARGAGLAQPQVDFVQDGALAPIRTTHTGVELAFQPEADGVTFRLAADFIAPLPKKPPVATKDVKNLPPPTTAHPTAAAPADRADGPLLVSAITGPVEPIAPGVFRVAFSRTASTIDARSHDIWLRAHHPGDARHKGAVQQALLRVPAFTEGAGQTIDFPPIADQFASAEFVPLAATSDAGVSVSYYVREGPAFVRGGILHFTPLPPRTRFPVTITVVAWQLGRGAAPKLRAALPVERSFRLFGP